MFIVLAFTACLLANPGQCKEQELTFSAYEVSYLTCVYRGQWALAEWERRNPGWRATRHRCEMSDDLDEVA